MLSGQTKNMFLTKTGIDIGALPVILDVRVCTGYKREMDGSIRKEYAKELVPYPLQVRDAGVTCLPPWLASLVCACGTGSMRAYCRTKALATRDHSRGLTSPLWLS